MALYMVANKDLNRERAKKHPSVFGRVHFSRLESLSKFPIQGQALLLPPDHRFQGGLRFSVACDSYVHSKLSVICRPDPLSLP
jgi:hypothetical protein